jgi:hypothetical protein
VQYRTVARSPRVIDYPEEALETPIEVNLLRRYTAESRSEPRMEKRWRFGEREEDVLVEAFVTHQAVERFDEGSLHRLCPDLWSANRSTGRQRKTAQLVSSVPLPLTMASGGASSFCQPLQFPHHALADEPGIDHLARYSRLRLSTTHRMRKR